MRKAGLLNQIPSEVWNKEWNVNCQAVGDPEASIKYLAPYQKSYILRLSNRVEKLRGQTYRN